MEIYEKILNGQKLTSKEVKLIDISYYLEDDNLEHIECIDKVDGWEDIDKHINYVKIIVQIDDKYFSVLIGEDDTSYDSYEEGDQEFYISDEEKYKEQIAKPVYEVKKTVYTWKETK